MSHEIRTPMNGLMGMLQLLQNGELKDSEQKRYVNTAIQSTKRLNRILADILDLSRVEAGKLRIVSESFEIRESVGVITQLFETTAAEKNINLKVTIDPAIPVVVKGDSIRLQQVLGNLVGNAIKFTWDGDVIVEACLLATGNDTEHRVLCKVQDTGVGISNEVLVTLFAPFSQEERCKQINPEGAGLGLAISKQLVALMGGNMAVVSEEGVGSTFYFCIPFGRVEHTSSSALAERSGNLPTGLKVLLADDDILSRVVATTFLEKMHYQVDAVDNGDKVLAKLRNGVFDLVLVDIHMPVLDGIETARGIRAGLAGQKNKNIPIIAVTACAMEGDKQRFCDAGMSGYVAKPVAVAELQKELVRLF